MTTYRLLIGGKPVARFESAVAEYRNGDGPVNHAVKISGAYKVTDVTLKRGVVGDAALANWVKGAKTKQNAMLQAIDAAGRTVASYSLANATVTKYTGPTLGGPGNDVAFEELELTAENLVIGLPPKRK